MSGREVGSTVAAAMENRGEAGQILPGLVVLLLALLALGVLFFQVGKASVLRSQAQTAADAAALAGATEIKRQLMVQWATMGTTDLSAIDDALVVAQMRRYAEKNEATLVAQTIVGVDVKATVTTQETVGEGARSVGKERSKGEAKARARITITGGLGGGASIGPVPGGGGGGGEVPKISDKEWKELGKDIGDGPPGCDDVVKLGHFLVEQGFLVGENKYFGGVGDMHEPGGYHYKCDPPGSGALDVNFGRPGDLVPEEVAAVDPTIAPLRDLGFRTIWRAAGHYNHLHVDIANSGPIGGGSGGADGGFAGPLEDVLLEVRLIDYNAPLAPFFGFGGVGSGYFYGPPDPTAARAICTVARRHHASDKVLLAAYEAAIVESGVHSLPFGDLDSIGLFQQRDSWGSYEQRMNPVWASEQFISRAIRQNQPWMSAGQLAQDVQVSAYPERYDQRREQALSLISTYCSG
jgi:putative Flp pilus-assembly TadE/G-like protein